jgi:hypothetical protein
MTIGFANNLNQKTKLILALQQIDNLTSLLEGNDYQSFLYSHLISMRTEMERQLSNMIK